MPKIATYDAPQGIGLHPTETGINATAAAARRVQGEYNEAAAAIAGTGQRFGSATEAAGNVAVKYAEHREVSAGATELAKLQDNFSKEWNETAKAADPNDQSVAPKFLEQRLEPALEQFKQGFNTEGGQRFAEAHVQRFREHMFHTTSSDMAQLAGIAVHNGSLETINRLGNMVYRDPSSLGLARDTLTGAAEGLTSTSPNLTAAQAAKVKSELMEKGLKQIVRGAVMGAVAKGADWEKIANDPKNAPYIDAVEAKQFEQAARYYKRLEQSEARTDRLMREHQQKTDFHEAVNELELKTIPQNTGERPTLPKDYWDQVRKLGQMPGAAQEPGRLRSMIHEGEVITERLNKPEPLGRVSHETTMGLLQRIRATDDTRLTDNSPIYDAYQQGKLSNADFNFLTREFASLRTPDGIALEKDRGNFVKTFARLIDGKMNDLGIHSMLGSQQMYKFEMDARRQEEALRKDSKDPHLVYDPRSEYFFGRPENIARYRVSLQEANKYEADLKSMDKNLTGPGKNIISIGVENKFVPPVNWQFSPSRKQYRDPAGRTYDLNGKEIGNAGSR